MIGGRRRAGLSSAGSTCTRATRRRPWCTASAPRSRPGCRGGRAHQRGGRDQRGLPGRPAGADPRPPEPDRPVPAVRPAPAGRVPAAVRRPDRAVLGPAARAGPREPTPAWPRACTRRCPARTTRRRPRSGCSRTLGADLVGMSTALEAIAARHLGAEVLAISLVTNLAAGLADHGLDHARGRRGRGGGGGPDRCDRCSAGAACPSGRAAHDRDAVIPAGLRAQVEAWIREDPDRRRPGRTAGAARRRRAGGRAGADRWPSSPTGSPAACEFGTAGLRGRWGRGRTG